MGAGRPTKLTPEVIEVARAYLDDYEQHGDVVPSIAGLAVRLKVAKTTVYAWAEDKEGEFHYLLGQIMGKQEQVLCSGGLKGDYNSTITKLMLTKHGYSDKQELTGEDGAALIPAKFVIHED